MKRICMAVSVISALAAGMFLYEGGILFFWYHDRRQGILILAAGAAVTVLFIWSIFRWSTGRPSSGEPLDRIWKRSRRDMWWTGIFTAVAVSGVTVYCMKFYSWKSIGILLLVMLCASLLLIGLGFVMMGCSKAKETAFQAVLLEKGAMWEVNGYAKYDETSSRIAEDIIDAKIGGYEVWTAASVILLGYCINLALTDKYLSGWLVSGAVVYVLLVLLIGGILLVQASQGIGYILNSGNPESVLGFYTEYYKYVRRQSESLMPTVQLHAVIALCDRENYEDALQLLSTIKRKPRMEAYYLQYEWICREGLGDYEECVKVLEKLKYAIEFVKGKPRKQLEQLCRLFEQFTNGDYETLIRETEEYRGTAGEIEFRKKLAEDARSRSTKERL